MDILQTELINDGHNEFFNNNQLTFFDDKFAFIKKTMRYDSDVAKIVNRMFFQEVSLNNPVSDKKFKQTFVNRFLNRQIAFQTVEVFSSQVVYVLLTKIDYLNSIYDDLDMYIQGKTQSDGDDTSTDQSDNRVLMSTLPQDQVNLNVDNTQLAYGDENTISRTKNQKTGNQKNTSSAYNLDNLIKTQYLLEEVFTEFDKKCFLQIW